MTCKYGIDHCEWIPQYYDSYEECVNIRDSDTPCYQRRDKLMCEYDCMKNNCNYEECSVQCVIDYCSTPGG